MPPLIKRLRTLFRRTRMERELDAELRFHLDMQAAQYVALGMSPQDARRAARQTFGGVEQVKDDVRDTWIARLTGNRGAGCPVRPAESPQQPRVFTRRDRHDGAWHWRQHRHLQRGQRRRAQPLPYERGDDLVHLRQPRDFVENAGFSINDIADIRRLSTTLDAVVEYHGMYFILLGGEEPERVETGVVSWDYFDALGIKPILGRTFRAEDDDSKAPAVLMLGYDYWQRTFNGDPEVVGRVFEMNDRPHTVVGILPDVPMYPQQNDVYMPRSACPFRMTPEDMRYRGHGMASAFGRRQPGVTLEQTESDMASVAAQLQRAYSVRTPSAKATASRRARCGGNSRVASSPRSRFC